jgi:hypothetical protein
VSLFVCGVLAERLAWAADVDQWLAAGHVARRAELGAFLRPAMKGSPASRYPCNGRTAA